MYEGRTRGKRIKYTFSDDEDGFYSDSTGNRRSSRNTGANTPIETGPVTTSSGRQIKAPPRLNMVADGNARGSVREAQPEMGQVISMEASGRSTRSAAHQGTSNGRGGASRQRQSDDDESEIESGDDEDDKYVEVRVEESESEDEDEDENGEEDESYNQDEMIEDGIVVEQPQTLVVRLSVTPPKLKTALTSVDPTPNMLPTPDAQDWKTDTSVPESKMFEMQDAPPVLDTQSNSIEPMSKEQQTPPFMANTPQTESQTSTTIVVGEEKESC